MKQTMILSAVTALGLLCAAGQAQVVISQVYGGGGNSGGTFDQDFIELKNTGNTPVDITGWIAIQASAGGSTATGNFSTSNRATPPFPAMILQPGQYYLIGCAFGNNLALADLPTPDVTATNITIGGSDGKVVLVNSNTLVSVTDPALFDQTTFNPIYGGGSPIVDMVGVGTNASYYEGADGTINTGNALAARRLQNGCQDTNHNELDFEIVTPDPHNSSSTIPCGASFPDIAVQLSNDGCNPIVGGAYTVTAQLTNAQTLAAANTTVSVVLPPTLNYVSSAPSVGSVVYTAGNRTVTWTVGTLDGSGSASISVSTTVASVGGLTVTASASTSTPNDPSSNNSDSDFNEVLASGAPLSVIAVGSFNDSFLSTSIDDNGTERELGTIYRPFTSANGEWIIFRTDLAGLPSETNGAVIVGHQTAGAWSFSMVAREGNTAPIASRPNAKIDNSGVNWVQGINNAGQYVYSTILRETGTPSDTLTDVIVKGTVAGGISGVIAEGDAPAAAELAGRTFNTLRSTTIQSDGTVSFMATLNGTTATNAVMLTDDGATVISQKGVTTPTGASDAISFLDDDGSSDGRGLFVSADGNSSMYTGAVNTGDEATDSVVVVNNVVVTRQSVPVGMFTDASGWSTSFGVNVPWVQMLPDGTWYLQGYNPSTAGFNQGQDWVMRNGTVITATGSPITPGSTELWADNALQRTYFVAAGGDAPVIGGLTNRSTAANGSDNTTDGVMVFNGDTVVAREGQTVEVATGDIRYLNLINDNRSFVAGNTLFVTATLRNATSICNQSFSNLPQAIVAITLPTINPPACTADIGEAGGEPGQDGLLDNNDFIAFITYFFAQDPIADMGMAGGEAGSDTLFDNNDFIAFITHFFAGCP